MGLITPGPPSIYSELVLSAIELLQMKASADIMLVSSLNADAKHYTN
jgi:hypothetical protein